MLPEQPAATSIITTLHVLFKFKNLVAKKHSTNTCIHIMYATRDVYTMHHVQVHVVLLPTM